MAYVYTVGPGLFVESDEPLMEPDLDDATAKVAAGKPVATVAKPLGARVFTPATYPDRSKGRIMVLREPLLALLESHYPDKGEREQKLRELVGG